MTYGDSSVIIEQIKRKEYADIHTIRLYTRREDEMANTERVLSVSGLCKSYGNKSILKNITFDVYKGEIFGFLGPNGSGKTTTIKCVLGLINSDSGTIKVCGKDIKEDFEGAMANIGGIIENPEMYKYLSGRENLEQFARMTDNVDKARVDEMIALVKLQARIDDKISKYSLGMRQRLGIAQALLHRPKLLMLDEPTNGLDPAGIKELRDILKELAAKEGLSVFISSHQLAELELMCDRFCIVDHGAVVDTKTMSEIKEVHEGESLVFDISLLDASACELAVKLLAEKGLNAEQVNDAVRVAMPREMMPEMIKTLVLADVPVFTVEKVTRSLEDAFMEVTKEDEKGGVGV